MSELDLQKLSAPIEALKPEVINAYKAIDSTWESVGRKLSDLTIPCDVKYCYSENPVYDGQHYCLEWRKYKGKKRFCDVYYSLVHDEYGIDEAERVTPYDEWSAEERLKMLEYVPSLFAEAEKSVKAFIAKATGGVE
ncbi:MAG: hypothetical protein AAF589_04665 [Planctomycetota bacterium]